MSKIITSIEWTNRIKETGIYMVKTNENQSKANNMWLPYNTQGNVEDGWIILATKIDDRYVLIQTYQYNAFEKDSTRRHGTGLIYHDGSSSSPVYWYNRDIGVSYN